MSSKKLYSLPPQWYRHSATQLHWPSASGILIGARLDKIEEVYCKIIEELHFYELIHLFVEDLNTRNRVMIMLSLKAVDLDRIIIHQKKISDIQARARGPVFVKDNKGEFIILNRGSDTRIKNIETGNEDDEIPAYVADKYNIECIDPGLKLKGSTLEVNGAGTLLATESLISDQNCDMDLAEVQIEEQLKIYLGVQQVIWLKSEGSSHVKNLTRWLNEETVLTMVTNDRTNTYYETLQKNLEILRKVILPSGKALKIETLPFPETNGNENESDLLNSGAAAYTGFYIANGAVLMPVYGYKTDDEASILMKKYFPGRKIIPIDCVDLIIAQASIHSVTHEWYGITY